MAAHDHALGRSEPVDPDTPAPASSQPAQPAPVGPDTVAHTVIDLPSDVAYSLAESADVAHVALRGELDLASVPLVRELMRSLVADQRRPPLRELVVDLHGLRFMDMAGLGAVLEARHALLARSGVVWLSGASPFIRRVLTLAGLDEMINDDPRLSVLPSSPASPAWGR